MQEIHEAIAKRTGGILSSWTILKADVYPSLLAPCLAQLLPGAPNLRQAEGHAPVFGVGISTCAGIRATLAAIGAAPDSAEPRTAVWFNLREEPVLYINGTPYVLREARGAYTNMKEYSGIDSARLEALEQRLKAEVLAEAAVNAGHVHVLVEGSAAQVLSRLCLQSHCSGHAVPHNVTPASVLQRCGCAACQDVSATVCTALRHAVVWCRWPQMGASRKGNCRTAGRR